MRRPMLTLMLVCALSTASCGGSPERTAPLVERLPCPPTLPELTCRLDACPDEPGTAGALQRAYLECQASSQCLAEHVGLVKRLHASCAKED